MNTAEIAVIQYQIRELSAHLLGKKEAHPAISPPKQKELTGPSTNLSASDKAPNQRPTCDGIKTPNRGSCGSSLMENGQTSRGAQNPSTLAELAAALRNPLPPSPAHRSLNLDVIRDLMAKEAAAREVLMKEYAERTGQAVDYCDYCNLGVREEEVEEEWGTRSEAMPCGECEGLGVVRI